MSIFRTLGRILGGMMGARFICKGCKHKLPIDYQIKTKGYCYMCDPNVTLRDLQ